MTLIELAERVEENGLRWAKRAIEYNPIETDLLAKAANAFTVAAALRARAQQEQGAQS